MLQYRPESLAAACIHAHEQLAAWDQSKTHIHVGPVEGVDLAGRSLTVVTIVDRNMPFIFDSIMGEVSNAHRDICLAAHPVFKLRRSADGTIKDIDLAVAGQTDEGWHKVSLVHVHLPRLSAEAIKLLKSNLLKVMDQVHRAVADWRTMLDRLDRIVAELQGSGGSQHLAEREEALAFLEWLRDDNFTFLGMREYKFSGTGKDAKVERAEKTGLGILSDPDVRVLRRGTGHVTTTPELLAFLQGPDALIVTKANVRSLVHRRTYMDYVGVKRYDESGRVTGELRIVGLFTSTAYTRSVLRIPLLRFEGGSRCFELRVRPGKPFRKGASQCARELPARRAVPDRCADAGRFLRTDHRIERQAARACPAAHRPVRPVRVRARLRAEETSTTPTHAAA